MQKQSWYVPLSERIGDTFGIYDHSCVGRVLNAMADVEKIPLTRVENVGVSGDSIHYGGKVVGHYKWIQDRFPVFCWKGDFEIFSGQRIVLVRPSKDDQPFTPSAFFDLRPVMNARMEVMIDVKFSSDRQEAAFMKALIDASAQTGLNQLAMECHDKQVKVFGLEKEGSLEMLDLINQQGWVEEIIE